MTDNFDSFFDQIDSERDFDDIRLLAIENHGVDPLKMYCLHTGKPIGTLDQSELAEAIYEEGDCDSEELADALVIRTLASMRPSPALNKPDHGTIREMAARRPVDALAFLMNRLYGSKQLLVNRGDDWFAPLAMRVKTHFKLSETPAADVYTSYIHWLLELDSKLNLHEVTPPLFEQDRLGKWLVTKNGRPLIDVIRFPGALEVFESWVFERLHEWDKKDSAALAQLRWATGNRMTSSAFVRSYLDNPVIANRKHAEEHARRVKAAAAKAANKPVRAKSEKTLKQAAMLKSFLDLMDQVIDGKVETPNATTPKKPKVMLGGMLFAKKESV